MVTAAEPTTLSRLLDPVRDCLTAEAARGIAALRADGETQARIDELAGKNAEAVLTPDERAEYEALVSAGNLIAVLQAKARSALSAAPSRTQRGIIVSARAGGSC